MPKLNTLTDNFDDNSLDTGKWTAGTSGSGASSAETGGQFVATLPTSSVGYAYIDSGTFDLSSSSITVELPVKPATTSGTEQALQLRFNSNNYIGYKVQSTILEMNHVIGGTLNTTTIPRDDAPQRWLRLSEDSGTIYWHTSPDGNTWTLQRTDTVSFDITSVKVRLHGGTWTSVASPGTAAFDNVNINLDDLPIYRNTAEGQSSGTTLTAANSGGGSGDAFDTVTVSGSLSVTYSSDMSMFGTQSYKVEPASSTALYIRPSISGAYAAGMQMYLYLPTYASTNQLFCAILSSGGAYSARMSINQEGRVIIANYAGSNVLISPTDLVPIGQWLRLDLATQVGSTTSNGRIVAQLSYTNSFTPFWSYDSGYATNTGTSALSEFRFGKLDTAPSISLFYMDNLAWRSGSIDFIPPESSAPQVAWFVT